LTIVLPFDYTAMAHGNLSDLVFLALLAVVGQFFACPHTLFQDVGPFKAQFKAQSADMTAMIKLAGGLLLIIGMMLSSVKWNPINGKMAGFGAFTSLGYTLYSLFQLDGAFVPRLLYAYIGVVLLGALHIFAMPSNPLPKKTPETKNNHGNFSDVIALSLLMVSLLMFFYPKHLYEDFGPFKAQLKSESPDLTILTKFVASLFLIVALMFSGVKWNPINGKLSGLGGFIAAGYTGYSSYVADGETIVPRLFYIYAVVLFLGALHIFAFPSNPVTPKPEKKE